MFIEIAAIIIIASLIIGLVSLIIGLSNIFCETDIKNIWFGKKLTFFSLVLLFFIAIPTLLWAGIAKNTLIKEKVIECQIFNVDNTQCIRNPFNGKIINVNKHFGKQFLQNNSKYSIVKVISYKRLRYGLLFDSKYKIKE